MTRAGQGLMETAEVDLHGKAVLDMEIKIGDKITMGGGIALEVAQTGKSCAFRGFIFVFCDREGRES